MLQPEFMAGVGRSDGGNGLHTGKFSRQNITSAYCERKEYAECIDRLGGVEKPAKCFAIVVEALERNPDQDFLGKLYMSLELGNHWKGQFFTPYNVCECMAGITINDNMQTLESRNGYLSMIRHAEQEQHL